MTRCTDDRRHLAPPVGDVTAHHLFGKEGNPRRELELALHSPVLISCLPRSRIRDLDHV